MPVGKAVVVHPDWSYTEDLVTGEKIGLVAKDGLFELHCWVVLTKGFLGRHDSIEFTHKPAA